MDTFNPQTNNQNNPSTPPTPLSPQPSGGIVPPPPKAPEVTIRTMASDIQSVQQSGGAEPTPQFITSQPSQPSTPNQPSAPHEPPLLLEEKHRGSIIKWITGIIILFTISGGLYYYGWPLINEYKNASSAPQETATAPAPVSPELTPAPAPSTLSMNATPENIPTIAIGDTLTSVITALQNEAQKKPADGGTMKEIKIIDANGPMSLSAYMQILLPEAEANGLAEVFATAFENSFGAYLFYDDKGVWPGYVLKLKPTSGVDMVTLTSRLQKLESSSYQNLFITPPGNAQGFKTGQVAGKYVHRLTSFSQPGASFNYGLFGQYLIINTSPDGLTKALEVLKL